MPSIQLPNYKISFLDKNGNMDREWYKFFGQLSAALGGSSTTADDLLTAESLDNASVEALALRQTDPSGLLFDALDLPKPPDYGLLGAWPGDFK